MASAAPVTAVVPVESKTQEYCDNVECFQYKPCPDCTVYVKSALEEKWDARTVRQVFVDFYKTRGHTFWPSSAVVPFEDPTLLFINAGMNQYKPIFLGVADPKSAMGKLKRATNSQKCIRAGGKHNDLDDVGKDLYHHTFFEMLGCWSFGDYFKKDTIAWAYELLVKVFGLDRDRLYATYFEGADGVGADLEARDMWREFLDDDHILPGNMADNFWEMGETGPCGPCSEVHYDRIGGGRNPAHLVNMDDPDVLEIWNLVFMQFNRLDDRSLQELPANSIDTGMGFERLVSVLQDKRSNYATDVFRPLFEAIRKETGARPYTDKIGDEDKDLVDTAYRVVADHMRNLTFALSDGAVPSSEGRGYVLRRILRRGVRYGKQLLGAKNGFLSRLSQTVVDEYGDFFPELCKAGTPERVQAILLEEEESFARTLDRGLIMFDKVVKDMKKGETVISGKDVATLYDTYGFPADLTEKMAEERNMTVDMPGFEAHMEQLKELSRQGGSKTVNDALKLGPRECDRLVSELKLLPTEDNFKFDWKTTGTGPKDFKATVKAIYLGDGKFADNAPNGAQVGIVLDQTNFYAIKGGQVEDVGSMQSSKATVTVEDVQPYAPFVLHICTVTGSLNVGDSVSLNVDFARRALIAKNHTTTHMLNFALREVLGGERNQKGSIVNERYLRFDFDCSKPLKLAEVAALEQLVQQGVDKKMLVSRESVALADAQKIKGLRFLVGNNYPDPVRVVSVGASVLDMVKDPNNAAWNDVSVEFCGGTHLDNAGEAETFKIISEEGVSKGIRRIEAWTGQAARDAVQVGEALLTQVKAAIKLKGAALTAEFKRLGAAVGECPTTFVLRAELRAELEKVSALDLKLKKAAVAEAANAALASVGKLVEASKAAKYVLTEIAVLGDNKALKKALDAFSKALPNTPVLVYSPAPENGKLAGMAFVPAGQKLTAQAWLGGFMAVCGGKGGGKGTNSVGAARSSEKLSAAVAEGTKLAAAF